MIYIAVLLIIYLVFMFSSIDVEIEHNTEEILETSNEVIAEEVAEILGNDLWADYGNMSEEDFWFNYDLLIHKVKENCNGQISIHK